MLVSWTDIVSPPYKTRNLKSAHPLTFIVAITYSEIRGFLTHWQSTDDIIEAQAVTIQSRNVKANIFKLYSNIQLLSKIQNEDYSILDYQYCLLLRVSRQSDLVLSSNSLPLITKLDESANLQFVKICILIGFSIAEGEGFSCGLTDERNRIRITNS